MARDVLSWSQALPFVLLGLRTAIREELRGRSQTKATSTISSHVTGGEFEVCTHVQMTTDASGSRFTIQELL